MVDKIINNIKLPNGEVYAIGGGSRYGLKGDYSTHYGIEYCQHGLIDNPVGTTDIIVKGGIMLCLPGADTKTTIGSDITYSVTSTSDVTIFYAEGNILEAGEVYYSLNEPADNGIENYMAWWNPDFGKWQFKSNDTGNVWREAIATPIADIRIEEGNIVRIDYIGYRVLNDDIYGLKSETADIDLNNLTEDGEKHFLNKTQISNCLLEVPQRIKLELNNGTITLKAGSQVIVPNGFEEDGVTTKFDYLDIDSDKTYTLNYSSTDKIVLMWNLEYSVLGTERFGVMSSGTTPSNYDQYGTWYDTNSNIVKYTNDSGVTWISGRSLPIAILNTNGANAIASIDKIFNGFGYIGSTIWIDKDVKGLIPNGRNEDGTLRNIEQVSGRLFVRNYNNLYASERYLFGSNINDIQCDAKEKIIISDVQPAISATYERWYNTSENKCYYHTISDTTWLPTTFIIYGTTSIANNTFTSFNIKQSFRAVDYNDAVLKSDGVVLKSDGVLYRNNKYEIAGWGMPSANYMNLTLNASGSEYTAPASGWIWFQTLPCTTVGYQCLQNNTMGINVESRVTLTQTRCSVILPILRGHKFTVLYDTQGTRTFRFYYAQGEVN